MNQYMPVVMLMALAVVFAALSFIASRLLAPRRPSAAKSAPYECGIVPSREPPERFPVGFYVVAMLFIMFDIEIIFLYPYAVDREVLGAPAFWTMFAFSVVFFLAFVYVVARGALDWGPVRIERPQRATVDPARLDDGLVDPERTTSSTIRRVGLEGREERETPGEAA